MVHHLDAVAVEVGEHSAATGNSHEHGLGGAADLRARARCPLQVSRDQAQPTAQPKPAVYNEDVAVACRAQVKTRTQCILGIVTRQTERSPHVLLMDNEFSEAPCDLRSVGAGGERNHRSNPSGESAPSRSTILAVVLSRSPTASLADRCVWYAKCTMTRGPSSRGRAKASSTGRP